MVSKLNQTQTQTEPILRLGSKEWADDLLKWTTRELNSDYLIHHRDGVRIPTKRGLVENSIRLLELYGFHWHANRCRDLLRQWLASQRSTSVV